MKDTVQQGIFNPSCGEMDYTGVEECLWQDSEHTALFFPSLQSDLLLEGRKRARQAAGSRTRLSVLDMHTYSFPQIMVQDASVCVDQRMRCSSEEECCNWPRAMAMRG